MLVGSGQVNGFRLHESTPNHVSSTVNAEAAQVGGADGAGAGVGDVGRGGGQSLRARPAHAANSRERGGPAAVAAGSAVPAEEQCRGAGCGVTPPRLPPHNKNARHLRSSGGSGGAASAVYVLTTSAFPRHARTRGSGGAVSGRRL